MFKEVSEWQGERSRRCQRSVCGFWESVCVCVCEETVFMGVHSGEVEEEEEED